MRNMFKPSPRILAIVAMGLLFSSQASADGILRYATIGEPPSLDVQMGTATIAVTIGEHIFETLYAFDSHYKPQPLLATGEKCEDRRKELVIGLRQGVLFHNGQEMTSADVVASLKRWGQYGARGALLMKNVTSLEATGKIRSDDGSFGAERRMEEHAGLSRGRAGHLSGGDRHRSRQQADRTEELHRHRPLQVRRVAAEPLCRTDRFEDYAKLDSPADGYAGAREANFDAIRFTPVPDVGTRVSGVQAGDYD